MRGRRSFTSAIYGTTLFIITLTGFGQMPIFKRYYIADIPGLGWLAQFYVTHYMHYLAASVLIALAAYSVIVFAAEHRGGARITSWGSVKAVLMLGLILTGILLVIRNLPGTAFSPTAITVLDISHLVLCMVLLLVSAVSFVKRGAWITR